MAQTLDEMMEAATAALAAMDYLACEDQCLAALAQARATQNWAYYARILLPLQECRRQRRMTAAEGRIRLGTATRLTAPETLLSEITTGCIVLTLPNTADDAARLAQQVRQQRQYVEVLFVNSPADASPWQLSSFAGPAVQSEVSAPPAEWVDRLFHFGEELPTQSDVKLVGPPTPADWFIDATEKLGDAALAQVDVRTPARERLDQLEARLEVVTDHEFLHQALAAAARELMRAG